MVTVVTVPTMETVPTMVTLPTMETVVTILTVPTIHKVCCMQKHHINNILNLVVYVNFLFLGGLSLHLNHLIA